jgi:hypothetical protein
MIFTYIYEGQVTHINTASICYIDWKQGAAGDERARIGFPSYALYCKVSDAKLLVAELKGLWSEQICSQ